MKEVLKTQGILLKKTWLANDDAVLDIFTADLGRVTVFAGKLARSKKRQLELDFFRLLEVELEKGKSSYRLKGVSTTLWFGNLQSDYALSEKCFRVFENLRKILPEEKPLPDFFATSGSVLGAVNVEQANLLLAFWEVKALQASGVCPRFDHIRGDMWWEFETFECRETSTKNGIKVENLTRQLLELLRRSALDEILEKAESLPKVASAEALRTLQKMSEYH